MATYNLREIKRRLPRGSFIRIAEATGVPSSAVGRVLNYGWYPQYHNKVVEAALSILDESRNDPDVMKHAKELGVVSAHSIFVPTRSRKKKIPSYYRPDKNLNWNDLCEMEEDELVGLCEDRGFKLSFWNELLVSFGGREDDLRREIAEALGIQVPESEIETDEEE